MTVVTPPHVDSNLEAETANKGTTFAPDNEDPDIIYISDEETPAPPKWPGPPEPTPQTLPSERTRDGEDTIDHTPPPPPWDEECLSMSDLEIDPEDLDDPLILEFCRAFWGMSDTTVDRRQPTPPSPASSLSSLDWESENFRPPTPPRRHGYVNLETQDRQYPYLGLQCYERVWRAQVMVPRTTPTAAVTNDTRQPTRTTMSMSPENSPHRSRSSNLTIPLTPGRKWLNSHVYESQPEQNNISMVAPMPIETFTESPVPSPPPLYPSEPLPPDMATVFENPSFEQLPPEAKKDIAEQCKFHQDRRARWKMQIWGQEYRVNLSRSGEVTIHRI